MPLRLDPDGHEAAALLELLPRRGGLRVLEIGCGDGRVTTKYAYLVAHVVAVDPDPIAIDGFHTTMPAALRSRIELRAGGIEALDLPSAAFDLVLLPWAL